MNKRRRKKAWNKHIRGENLSYTEWLAVAETIKRWIPEVGHAIRNFIFAYRSFAFQKIKDPIAG